MLIKKDKKHAQKQTLSLSFLKKNNKSHIIIFSALSLFFTLIIFSSGVNTSAQATYLNDKQQQKQNQLRVISTKGNWAIGFDKSVSQDREELLETKTDDQAPPSYSGNGYVPGQCTWYAFNRRAELGLPIGGMWGNAGQWPYSAAASGYLVDHNPRIGDVFVGLGTSIYGHVAVVEEIGPNDSVRISEMNYGGPFQWNTRWISNASAYLYIH